MRSRPHGNRFCAYSSRILLTSHAALLLLFFGVALSNMKSISVAEGVKKDRQRWSTDSSDLVYIHHQRKQSLTHVATSYEVKKTFKRSNILHWIDLKPVGVWCLSHYFLPSFPVPTHNGAVSVKYLCANRLCHQSILCVVFLYCMGPPSCQTLACCCSFCRYVGITLTIFADMVHFITYSTLHWSGWHIYQYVLATHTHIPYCCQSK